MVRIGWSDRAAIILIKSMVIFLLMLLIGAVIFGLRKRI